MSTSYQNLKPIDSIQMKQTNLKVKDLLTSLLANCSSPELANPPKAIYASPYNSHFSGIN